MVESSYNAARYALRLAKLNEANVTLLYVTTIPYFPRYFESLEHYVTKVKEEAEEWFNKIRSFEEANEVNIDQVVNTSALSIVEGILSIAEEGKFDLIVISPRGRSTFKRLLLGSVTSGVVTYSTIPVLVYR
jgi:nucleotide-binding universal stress UspA family protein